MCHRQCLHTGIRTRSSRKTCTTLPRVDISVGGLGDTSESMGKETRLHCKHRAWCSPRLEPGRRPRKRICRPAYEEKDQLLKPANQNVPNLSQGVDVNWGFALFLPPVARFFVSFFLTINFFSCKCEFVRQRN